MNLRNQILNRFTWPRLVALGACGAALVVIGYGTVGAQLAANRNVRTVSGRIQEFTTAPRGEVDGATLSDGTLLHWPPHVGERVTEMVKKGDRVEATGQTETGPRGDTHFEVSSITNMRTDASLDVATIGPPALPLRGGPRSRPGREVGESRSVRGLIERFTTAPRGEVDGAVLSEGSVIHWPPHLQERFTSALKQGDEVNATGWMETTPRGDTRLEVANVTNAKSGASIDNDDAPRRGPRRFSVERDPARDQRLTDLQAQLDRIQREIDQLRREQ
jgi:hypothetical protein